MFPKGGYKQDWCVLPSEDVGYGLGGRLMDPIIQANTY